MMNGFGSGSYEQRPNFRLGDLVSQAIRIEENIFHYSDSSSDIIVLSNLRPIMNVTDNSVVESSDDIICSECVQNQEMEIQMSMMRDNLQFEVLDLKYEKSGLKFELEMKAEVNKDQFI